MQYHRWSVAPKNILIWAWYSSKVYRERGQVQIWDLGMLYIWQIWSSQDHLAEMCHTFSCPSFTAGQAYKHTACGQDCKNYAMCKYDNMQSLQKELSSSQSLVYMHSTCKVWGAHFDGVWIWCFFLKILYVYVPGQRQKGRGGVSQSVFEHGIIWGGAHPLFPETELSLIVSSPTGLLCIKTICKPASLVFGQNAPSHNLYLFTAKKIL